MRKIILGAIASLFMLTGAVQAQPQAVEPGEKPMVLGERIKYGGAICLDRPSADAIMQTLAEEGLEEARRILNGVASCAVIRAVVTPVKVLGSVEAEDGRFFTLVEAQADDRTVFILTAFDVVASGEQARREGAGRGSAL